MDNDRNDTELRRRFALMRQDDEAATPPFERLCVPSPAKREAPRTRWFPARMAVAGASLIAIVALTAHFGSDPSAPSRAVTSISEWCSPTRSLENFSRGGGKPLSVLPPAGIHSAGSATRMDAWSSPTTSLASSLWSRTPSSPGSEKPESRNPDSPD